MRIKARALPAQYKLTEQERADYDGYIAKLLADYPNVTPFDLVQAEGAALEHILALRLIAEQLESNRHVLNTRYSHHGQEQAILTNLALTRSARLRGKTASDSSEADQLRDLLFSLSDGRADAVKNGRIHDS